MTATPHRPTPPRPYRSAVDRRPASVAPVPSSGPSGRTVAAVGAAVGVLLAVGALAPTPWTDDALRSTFGAELDAEGPRGSGRG